MARILKTDAFVPRRFGQFPTVSWPLSGVLGQTLRELVHGYRTKGLEALTAYRPSQTRSVGFSPETTRAKGKWWDP